MENIKDVEVKTKAPRKPRVKKVVEVSDTPEVVIPSETTVKKTRKPKVVASFKMSPNKDSVEMVKHTEPPEVLLLREAGIDETCKNTKLLSGALILSLTSIILLLLGYIVNN